VSRCCYMDTMFSLDKDKILSYLDACSNREYGSYVLSGLRNGL
jgi:hypothetical protein